MITVVETFYMPSKAGSERKPYIRLPSYTVENQ